MDKLLNLIFSSLSSHLRLIAELVFLASVGEQTAEESMQEDIVCKLAIMNMPHSRYDRYIEFIDYVDTPVV